MSVCGIFERRVGDPGPFFDCSFINKWRARFFKELVLFLSCLVMYTLLLCTLRLFFRGMERDVGVGMWACVRAVKDYV